MQTVSVTYALWRARLVVYGPFFPLIIGIPAHILRFTTLLHAPVWLILAGMCIGIIAAWLWWSYRVPRWRLWALQHVVDIEALHERAVLLGIEWPYGHFFERTEIKSRQHHLEEISLQLQYYLQRLWNFIVWEQTNNASLAAQNEIEYVIALLAAQQRIAPYTLDFLKQSLINFLEQADPQEAEISKYRIFATTAYFIDKYRSIVNYS